MLRCFYCSVCLLLLFCAFSPLFAQDLPLFLIPGRYFVRDSVQPPLLMGSMGQSIFLLQRGALARYDAATQQLTGVAELFGTRPRLDTRVFDDLTLRNQYIFECTERLLPPLMIVDKEDIQVLIGDRYFRVNPLTMEITLDAPLATLQERQLRQNDSFFYNTVAELASGDELYRVEIPRIDALDSTLTAIDRKTGRVLLTRKIPAALRTRPVNFTVPREEQIIDLWKYAQNPPLTLAAAGDSLYILRQGVLVKCDAETLEEKGVIHLHGAVATLEANATAEEKISSYLQNAKRLLPGVLLLEDQGLTVIIGDDFFRVDVDTMTVSAKGQFYATPNAELKERLERLFVHGNPRVGQRGSRLYLVEDTRVYIAELSTGKVTESVLPELLTRNFVLKAEPGELIVEPRDGAVMGAMGLLLKSEDGLGWRLLDAATGELHLTGNQLTNFITPMKDPEFACIQAMGTVKIEGKQRSLEVIFLAPVHQITLQGTAARAMMDEKPVWVLTQPTGLKYSIVGAGAAALDVMPDVEGKMIIATGTFEKEHANLPLVGEAFLNAASCRTVESLARTEVFPTALAISDTALYVTRAGAVAVLDLTTLAATKTIDFFPPMPDYADDEKVTAAEREEYLRERAQRIAAPLLVVNENGLFLAIGTHLFSSTTDFQQIQTNIVTVPKEYKSTPSTFLSGNFYAVAIDNDIHAYDIRDVTDRVTLALPKDLTARLFPDTPVILREKL